MMNRRLFLSKTAAATVGLAAPSRPGVARKSPNDTINVAIIGIRGDNKGHPTWTARGRGQDHYEHLAGIPNVRVTHVVDIDERHFKTSLPFMKEKWGGDPKTETDFRRVLDNRDVDAVTIATPDHWHALMTIWACQAGKDVYVEKPISHNIFEGRRMIEAAAKYNRVVAVGTQSRSSASARRRPFSSSATAGSARSTRAGRSSIASARSDRRRGEQPGAAGRATTTCGSGPRPRVRSTRTASTTTGTGSGNTAPATSATPASIRWTRCAGCSANRNIPAHGALHRRPARGRRADRSGDAEYAAGDVTSMRTEPAPLRSAQLVQRADRGPGHLHLRLQGLDEGRRRQGAGVFRTEERSGSRADLRREPTPVRRTSRTSSDVSVAPSAEPQGLDRGRPSLDEPLPSREYFLPRGAIGDVRWRGGAVCRR